MKKNWLLLCFFLFISFNLLFGESDQVFLKNGQVIEGIVQNYEIGKFVEIVTVENLRQIINWEQIESLNLASDNESVIEQPKSEKPEIKLDYDAKKGITFDQTLDSDQLRLNWESQGGIIRSTEAALNFIITKMEIESLNPDTTNTDGKIEINGAGFGYTFNKSFLKFSPPNYADNKYYSYAIKLGFSAGLNVNMFVSKYENLIIDSLAGVYKSTTDISMKSDIRIGTLEFGLNLGANFGLGRFLNPQKWGGVILGIAWRPTWQLTSTNTSTLTNNTYVTEVYVPYYQYYFDMDYYTEKSTKEKSQFSWSAVEFSLDFGGIKAMTDKMAKRAHFRINCMIIPPLGEYKMSMLYLGMGMVWYK